MHLRFQRLGQDNQEPMTTTTVSTEDPILKPEIVAGTRVKSICPLTGNWRRKDGTVIVRRGDTLVVVQWDNLKRNNRQAISAQFLVALKAPCKKGAEDKPPVNPALNATTAGSVVHKIKCWPAHFKQIANGTKRFEIRKNDRNYKAGDTLVICEWNIGDQSFTGFSVRMHVDSVLQEDLGLSLTDNWGLRPGFVAMSLSPLDPVKAHFHRKPFMERICDWLFQ